MKTRPWLAALLVLVAAIASAQPVPCQFSPTVDDFGRIWIQHSFEANCGIEDFAYVVTFEPGLIHVREEGLCPMGLAVCLCPYGTDVVLAGLAPGTWNVDWTTCEVDLSSGVPVPWCGEPCMFTIEVASAPSLPDSPRFAGYAAQGCGVAVSAVPDGQPGDVMTWGTMKVFYR
jgi:hypothetical protein